MCKRLRSREVESRREIASSTMRDPLLFAHLRIAAKPLNASCAELRNGAARMARLGIECASRDQKFLRYRIAAADGAHRMRSRILLILRGMWFDATRVRQERAARALGADARREAISKAPTTTCACGVMRARADARARASWLLGRVARTSEAAAQHTKKKFGEPEKKLPATPAEGAASAPIENRDDSIRRFQIPSLLFRSSLTDCGLAFPPVCFIT